LPNDPEAATEGAMDRPERVVARENAVTTALPLCKTQKLAWANMATAKTLLNPRVGRFLNMASWYPKRETRTERKNGVDENRG